MTKPGPASPPDHGDGSTSELTEDDGSPLRGSFAVDIQPDRDAEARAAALRQRDRLEVPGDDESSSGDLLGGGAAGRLDTVGEGVVFSRAKAPHRLEWCEVCAWPLKLAWKQFPCEFPDGPMPDGEFCHCNSCLSEPKWSNGRPRYCSLKCAANMDNAVDRARRWAPRPIQR